MIPFTEREFFQVFADYNNTIWPAQVLLIVVAIGLIGMALRARPAGATFVWLGLSALWLWSGVVYHITHFSAVNPAAYAFGALFIVQSILFAGAATSEINVRPSNDAWGKGGFVLVGYALVAYPIIGLIAGERYPALPTFGAPCPITLYTLGLMLWTQGRVPLRLLVVPGIWAGVATSAALSFGVLQDLLLPFAAVTVSALLVRRNRALARARRSWSPGMIA
jgi:hypothetical protein